MNLSVARFRVCLPFLAVALAGCASLGGTPTADPAVQGEVSRCRQLYVELDALVDAAGVRDAGSYQVPGFPYLRSNRFLASLDDRAITDEGFVAWVGHLRQQDLAVRAIELRNATVTDLHNRLERLEACGKMLAALDLADAAQRQRLRDNIQVPADYSVFQRIFGFYPFAVPFLNRGIGQFHAEVRRDYATPLAQLDAPGELRLWQPPEVAGISPETAARWLSHANEDALGIPRLEARQWQQLVETHAPAWWQETNGDFDLPGTPRLSDGKPTLDDAQPVTYYLTTWTRFGGEVLPQLVYVVWFSERPPLKKLDSYAGALDSVIWRVTLSRDGRPLVYDTVHSCGCYRYYFPAQPLTRRPQGGTWDEPMLFPQGEIGSGPQAIRLQTATHFVRRVVPVAAAAGTTRHYRLQPYDALLSLDNGTGGRQSLFGQGGIVRGTERAERFWLWPSGVKSPGAMRQWGRHATSFVGQSHFDDADFLDRMFEAPR